MKKILLVIATLFLMTGCGNKNLGIDFDVDGNIAEIKYGDKNPVVAMEIENYGTIVMELYPEYAPNTVNNFISLVKSGFYDNNSFHRLVPGFVLQGGDPEGTGTGGPGYSIYGEFETNKYYKNTLKHEKGIVSMARSGLPNSAGSQFFICLDTASNLDGSYAAFGKVIKGMDVIEKIASKEKVAEYAEKDKASVIVMCAKMESELVELSEQDRKVFLKDLGIEYAGLDKLIFATYNLLGLETFFTVGKDEVRAWTFKKGMKAPSCAGIIHSDFERGFIKAEVTSFNDLEELKSEKAVKESGKLRLEGKDYIMQDGDICYFRFNV